MKQIFVVCLILCVYGVKSFLFGDPCDVTPNNWETGIPADPNFTVHVNVPTGCMNGTFRWDYPKGHAIVRWTNPYGRSSAVVCFKEILGGEIFTIIDQGNGSTISVQRDDRTWVCASPTNSSKIVFQIDAPDTMYYMGEIGYKINSQ